MPRDHRPDLIRPRRSPRNRQPPLHPQGALSPEASSRLVQQIARILQRLRTVGAGRVEHVRRKC
jgi:hypothetical protein